MPGGSGTVVITSSGGESKPKGIIDALSEDVLEGEKSCRFLPLFIAPETRKILIITAASRTTSRPLSGSMTIVSSGSTDSGGLIWKGSYTAETPNTPGTITSRHDALKN